jgi:hypothetical protein
MKQWFAGAFLPANMKNLKKSGRSEVPVLPQPVHLGRQVPVDNIALVVLETPRDHNQGIPFPDPDALLDLSLDPPHTRDPIETAHPDMVCPHHQVGGTKHLVVPFLGQPDPDKWRPVRIYCIGIELVVPFSLVIIGYTNNSSYINGVGNH